MSIHADLKPDVVARLASQRRKSTISSLVISLLVVVLIGLVLGFFLLPPLTRESPVIVTYQSNIPIDQELTQKKVQTNVERKPSAPSSSMAKVITASTVSDISIPVPEVDVPVPSMDFGDGDDFGSGWGDGDGFGGGGGGAEFFGQKVKAGRIAFVIDYSGSMNGVRDKLMREELQKSLDTLTEGTEFSLIFFAGPVWQAGDEVVAGPNKGKHPGTFTVKAKSGGKFDWKLVKGAIYEPKTKSKVQKMDWKKVTKAEIVRVKRDVKSTKLVYGTIWDWPLKAALEMDPQPDTIYFMTDGNAGVGTMDIAKEMGRAARRKGITINCIALMVPAAQDGLKELAKRSGGLFTIIEQNGKAREVPLK